MVVTFFNELQYNQKRGKAYEAQPKKPKRRGGGSDSLYLPLDVAFAEYVTVFTT
jgi:hypothetical protein